MYDVSMRGLLCACVVVVVVVNEAIRSEIANTHRFSMTCVVRSQQVTDNIISYIRFYHIFVVYRFQF